MRVGASITLLTLHAALTTEEADIIIYALEEARKQAATVLAADTLEGLIAALQEGVDMVQKA